MCRFVAYLGKKPVIIGDVIDKPENSLINQSRQAREGKFGLNADGFGIGWYEHAVDHKPGLFKSIQPAWNDHNLRHMSAKIRSNCFIGHVRASTVGDVNTFNCHPFNHKQFLFVHNGTIRGFDEIKRQLQSTLEDDKFNIINGQTDSEHFFAMMMDVFSKKFSETTLDNLFNTFQIAIETINSMQHKLNEPTFTRLNSVLTDGRQLLATRYVSDEMEKALSLYYSLGDYVDTPNGSGVMHATDESPSAILIASEPLTDYAEEWEEVPINHAILVDDQLKFSLRAIK